MSIIGDHTGCLKAIEALNRVIVNLFGTLPPIPNSNHLGLDQSLNPDHA